MDCRLSALYKDFVKMCMRSSLDTEVTSDDPFLSRCDFLSFVEEALVAMLVEQCQTDFWFNDHRLCAFARLSGILFCLAELRVEDCLAAYAAGAYSRQVD